MSQKFSNLHLTTFGCTVFYNFVQNFKAQMPDVIFNSQIVIHNHKSQIERKIGGKLSKHIQTFVLVLL